MKVSLITVTYNSSKFLEACIRSVISQDHADIEHIIVDGGSTDATVDIIKKYSHHVSRWVSEKDRGMYDALNKGITMATGEVIGILHSDDFFASNNVISTIAETFDKNNIDAVYGDVAFVRPKNLQKVVRYCSGAYFRSSKFAYGYMPPHPSFYVKKQAYKEHGLYKADYEIAADYELLMRFMFRRRIRSVYLSQLMVIMRTGGISNKTFLSRYVLNKEIVRACKENRVYTNLFILSFKYFYKVFEYIRPAFSALLKRNNKPAEISTTKPGLVLEKSAAKQYVFENYSKEKMVEELV